ncbi:MAG: hypothetical protein ACTS3F_01540 [Phycisphaerales bacterium]
MSATDRADALNSLLVSLRKKYKPEAPPERSAIEELVHAMVLWESASGRADRAFKRLMDAFVDLNELRVSRPDEVAEVLGKTYPLADERARRLLAALEAIYVQEHAVSLEGVASGGKRDARKYLDAIESLPAFAVARVAVLRLDGHAVPLEDRTVAALIECGVLEEGVDLARAVGQMERMVKAAESVEVALLLQAWTDDGLAVPRRGAKKSGAASVKKAGGAGTATKKKAPAKKAAGAGGGGGGAKKRSAKK